MTHRKATLLDGGIVDRDGFGVNIYIVCWMGMDWSGYSCSFLEHLCVLDGPGTELLLWRIRIVGSKNVIYLGSLCVNSPLCTRWEAGDGEKQCFVKVFWRTIFQRDVTPPFLNRQVHWNRFSGPPILGPYIPEQSVRHHYFGKRGVINIGLRDWSATLSLLNKVCNSIYYKKSCVALSLYNAYLVNSLQYHRGENKERGLEGPQIIWVTWLGGRTTASFMRFH